MKPINKIKAIKKDLIKYCGKDDATVKALELKQQYLKIANEFERVREFQDYTVALEFVCEKFHVSKSTAKRAIKCHKRMVHKIGLKGE